jgi:hypothetical protein
MALTPYHSFLLRLWREPGAGDGSWRGEVEIIQSGDLIAVSSPEEAFDMILRATTGNDEGQLTACDVSPIEDSDVVN